MALNVITETFKSRLAGGGFFKFPAYTSSQVRPMMGTGSRAGLIISRAGCMHIQMRRGVASIERTCHRLLLCNFSQVMQG